MIVPQFMQHIKTMFPSLPNQIPVLFPMQGGAPPSYKLVYNPNDYRYNPLINPSYSTYKPTER